ncbi:MAG TPA: hypothetical protein PKY56_12585 [Candidatus Kapabacteria bacterium]|nr:hypothetical protein [Candidatus Kapabacteria bacterium]HPO61723.1 hypothetical protein [Candidatus Kapabacteria bacterium]
MKFSEDITELLFLLNEFNVKYLIVGGEAVIFYGVIRLTGDIDIFYEISKKNVHNLFNALNKFWNYSIPGIKDTSVFFNEGTIVQFGFPPNRIDLINKIDGIDFEKCWSHRKVVQYQFNNNKIDLFYISLEDLIKNKEASGRIKDLLDVENLEKLLNLKN